MPKKSKVDRSTLISFGWLYNIQTDGQKYKWTDGRPLRWPLRVSAFVNCVRFLNKSSFLVGRTARPVAATGYQWMSWIIIECYAILTNSCVIIVLYWERLFLFWVSWGCYSVCYHHFELLNQNESLRIAQKTLAKRELLAWISEIRYSATRSLEVDLRRKKVWTI